MLIECYPRDDYDSYMTYFNNRDWVVNGGTMPVYIVNSSVSPPFPDGDSKMTRNAFKAF